MSHDGWYSTPACSTLYRAVQYMDGTTKNPLVTGKNTSTNSDLRIFSSDNNATIKAYVIRKNGLMPGSCMHDRFAESAEHFAKTCSALFERMIDTVPRGVLLSEVLEPLPVKPMTLQVQALVDGTFTLTGDVRVSQTSRCHARGTKVFSRSSGTCLRMTSAL